MATFSPTATTSVPEEVNSCRQRCNRSPWQLLCVQESQTITEVYCGDIMTRLLLLLHHLLLAAGTSTGRRSEAGQEWQRSDNDVKKCRDLGMIGVVAAKDLDSLGGHLTNPPLLTFCQKNNTMLPVLFVRQRTRTHFNSSGCLDYCCKSI